MVTGAGSGIGKATALQMAREGARVAVIDLVETGEETVRQIREWNGDAIFIKADISETQQIRNAVDATVQKWGRIDVVVNDAALMIFGPVINMREEDWDRVLAVNLRSVFAFCKYSIPHMHGQGSIVNLSSVHAHENTANCSSYAASKGGIEVFTRALSRELEGTSIRVNCVAPGAVDTPMLWNNPNVKNGREKVDGAIGKPEEIAHAICFLASDESNFIQGTTLIADGGRLDIL
jgi:NAD(P)-dependent dehydrogenase (short-subunit alcohol dehydrogenase family)